MAKQMIDPELLDLVSGGAFGLDPDSNGTYTMVGEYTGQRFTGVTLANAIEIAKYGASVPNTAEGEKQIIDWAKGKNYI